MLEFETLEGNKYAWDDNIGLFIPFPTVLKALINEISSHKSVSRDNIVERLKSNFPEEEIAFYHDWIKKWEKLSPQTDNQPIHQDSSISKIKYETFRYGLSNLILGVTEDCNFRCKYCVFSDYYEYSRSHSDMYMDFTTAKKAIDYYFSLLDEGHRYNPLREPTISFYGGEPLLNFELIKKCVEYSNNKFDNYKIKYTITTNGSLLGEKKAKWLMEHDFTIAISLDGPEKEHDRNRVYKNSEKGTFKDIMKNISLIIDSEYEKIFSAPVYDWKSDLFKLEEFFNRKDIPFLGDVSSVNRHVEGCSYFEQFTEEDYINFMTQFKKAREYYCKFINQKKAGSFFYHMAIEPIEREFIQPVSIYPPDTLIPYTTTCIPGKKIYVNVNGIFYVCERVNHSIIGNVDEGLNFEEIKRLMSNYHNKMDKCHTCNLKRKCGYCYDQFETNNGFSCSSKVCENEESNKKNIFIETFIIAENYPEVVDMSYGYKNIKKFYGE